MVKSEYRLEVVEFWKMEEIDVDIMELEVKYVGPKNLNGLPDHFTAYPTYYPKFLEESREYV